MLVDIVERLSNWKHASFRRDGSTLETMMEAANEITSLRAELEKAKKDGWISVDTALPKENTIVIAYTHKVEIRKFCKFKFAEMTSKVTHWQPLPEPPKE